MNIKHFNIVDIGKGIYLPSFVITSSLNLSKKEPKVPFDQHESLNKAVCSDNNVKKLNSPVSLMSEIKHLQPRCCYPESPAVAVTLSAALSFSFQVTGQQHPVDVSLLGACFSFSPLGKDEWTQCACVCMRVFVSRCVSRRPL